MQNPKEITSEKKTLKERPVVGLLVTCLVDVLRPQIGFSSIELLERSGAQVFVPSTQTCCGQIAYNAGNRTTAVSIAEQIIDSFADTDYIVAPSGSCIGMLWFLYRYVKIARTNFTERQERSRAFKGIFGKMLGVDRFFGNGNGVG